MKNNTDLGFYSKSARTFAPRQNALFNAAHQAG